MHICAWFLPASCGAARTHEHTLRSPGGAWSARGLPAPRAALRCAALPALAVAVAVVAAGEFDAFHTIMAILRTRHKAPGLDPSQYYERDEEFRDFIDCKPCAWGMGPVGVLGDVGARVCVWGGACKRRILCVRGGGCVGGWGTWHGADVGRHGAVP